MDKQALFEIWAPSASPWSQWAKPAIFSRFEEADPRAISTAQVLTACVPAVAERSAVVAVLPGSDAVRFGLEVARLGYRPVPLFNSCPPMLGEKTGVHGVVVDATAILTTLAATASELASFALRADAPPAFLIDSGRMGSGPVPREEVFDNRSAVFAADFPSAAFVRAHGIVGAVLVHDSQSLVGNDLRYALRHWPADGLPIVPVKPDGSPLELSWPGTRFWAEVAQRWTVLTSFRRSVFGGFGAFVPKSSGG